MRFQADQTSYPGARGRAGIYAHRENLEWGLRYNTLACSSLEFLASA